MKTSSYLFFVFIVLSKLWAQSPQLLVQDIDKQTVPFATVIISNKTEKKVLTTDNNGIVLLPLDGLIHIKIAAFGFLDYYDTLQKPQSKTITLQYKVVELEECVVTAQLKKTTVSNAIQKMTVISNERIEEQGAVNLEDVLQYEPNIRISQDPVLGSGITMQGASGQNVKILIDGVPVIGRLGGNIDLSQINLDNIDRIEIIKGPSSTTYGADALAGTINLITKKHARKKKISASLGTYYESIGQYNANGALGFGSKKTTFLINGGRNFFNGWSEKDTSRRKDWKPKLQYFSSYKAQRILKKGTIALNGSYFYEKITNKGLPREPYFENAFDDYYYTKRLNQSLLYQYYPNSHNKLSILVAYNHYQRKKTSYFIDLTTLEQSLLEDKQAQDTTAFDLYMSRGSYLIDKDSSKLSTQIGYDFNHESTKGKRIEGQFKSIGDYALYTTFNYTFDTNFTAQIGARYSINTVYDAPIVPTLYLKYIKKNNQFRVSYGSGFRAPSLKELYFEFVDINHNIIGNDELKAEKSHNFQFNWTKQTTYSGFNIQPSVGIFYNRINNLITLAQTTESAVFTYVNIGRFQSTGFSSSLAMSNKVIKMEVGLNYLGVKSNVGSENVKTDFQYSPEMTYNFTLKLKPQTSLSMFYKNNGKVISYFVDENDELQQGFKNPFSQLDMTISQKIKKKVSVQLGVKNLFDVVTVFSNSPTSTHSTSQSSTSISMGRTFFFRTSIKL